MINYKVPIGSGHSCHVSKLRIPMSFIVGGGITGVTTWALVKNVQGRLAHASVDPRPDAWLSKARTDYDHCYNGCNDCHDLNFPYKACLKTSQVNVIDAVCDGDKMWRWVKRYPAACLEELGGRYKSEALAELKQ